jgi:putative ABC transport system permease protein
MTPRWVHASQRFYRSCLVVYPRAFRARHGDAMTLMFGDLSRETIRHKGLLGLIGLWARTFFDLVVNGLGERSRRGAIHRSSRPGRHPRRNGIGNVLRDIAYASRVARKQPGLLVAATLTLAVGIGANVSIFTFVHGVLMQPLPHTDAQQLMMVRAVRPDGVPGSLGYEDVATIAEQVGAFSAFAGYSASLWDLTGVNEPERVQVATVTADFFLVMQWIPARGRVWGKEEEGPTQPRVVVLTDQAWRTRFGQDPGIIGKSISLDDTPHTIIGVLRPGLVPFPNRSVEFFVPPRENFGLGAFWLTGLGRLRPRMTIGQAESALDLVAGRMATEHPDLYTDRGLSIQSLRAALVEGARQALVMLLAAVALVLIVAVSNVANLILTRSIGRAQEFAIRSALGAGRRRIAQQVIVEGLLLGVLGGAVGLIAGLWATKVLLVIGPADLPRRDDVVFDPAVAAFAFGLAILVGLAVGTLSAIRVATGDTHGAGALREGGGMGGGSHVARRGWRPALTVVQVAIAFVLLAGAGLLLKSFWTLARVDPGFTSDNIVSFRVSLPRSRFPSPASIAAFHDELRDRLAGVDGITSLASVSLHPFIRGKLCNTITIPEQADAGPDCVEFRSASAGYFELLGMRLLRGRSFNSSDNAQAPPRAVVNQRLADLVWPGQDPVGRQFTMWKEYPNTTVIGVVSNVHQFSLDREPVAEVYMPQTQFPFRYAYYLLHVTTDPVATMGRVSSIVWELNATVPISDVTTLDALINGSIAEPRFRTVILTGFAVVALVVSLTGVAAVVAYNVRLETRAIGLRMALGASRARVLGETLGVNVRLVGMGLVLGLGIALGSLRVLGGFLFGVTPFDLAVFVGAVVILGGLGTLACYLPARHVSRVDPMVSLRA